MLDSGLTIVWINDAYAHVTMRKPDEIIGRYLFDAFPADLESDSYRQLSKSLQRVIETAERDEIALIHYPIQNPDGTMSDRYWSATHTPIRDADGNVSHVLQHTVDVTELHELRTLRDNAGLVQRAREVEKRSEAARAQLERIRNTVEQAPGFVAILAGPDHRFELANAAYRELIGGRDPLGKPVAEALPEVVEQGFVNLLDRVYQSGESFVGRRVEVRLRGEREGELENRVVDFIYHPIAGPEGAVSAIFVQGYDVTDQARADEQQRVMINELNHRVKNTLAIVQGLAKQSFRTVAGGDAAYQVFNRRLEALSAAHGLLTDRKWEAARLSDVLRTAVVAAVGDRAERCHVHGDDSELGPQTAVSLAMLVHELLTNAIKYGALSVDGGRIDITARVDADLPVPMMTLVWRESGGPRVVPPETAGFGTRLIRRGIANHKDAVVNIDYAPDGLICEIVAAAQ